MQTDNTNRYLRTLAAYLDVSKDDLKVISGRINNASEKFKFKNVAEQKTFDRNLRVPFLSARGICFPGFITRNGKQFYEVPCRDIEYALVAAQHMLYRLREHPVNFTMRNWRDELLGRKVLYREQPAIVDSIIEDQGCIMIMPENGAFTTPAWHDGEDGMCPPDCSSAKCEYLDPNIWWFRK